MQWLQAVAGNDHNISLISIVEARVVSLLKGKRQGTHGLTGAGTLMHAHISRQDKSSLCLRWKLQGLDAGQFTCCRAPMIAVIFLSIHTALT